MTKKTVSRETIPWRWVTDRGIRLETGTATLLVYRRLMEAGLPGVAELVPADGSLLVVLKPGARVPIQLQDILNGVACGVVSASVGNRHEIAASLFAPGYTMAAAIANEFSEAVENLHLAALSYVALTLFLVTVLINAAARLLIWRVARGGGGKGA